MPESVLENTSNFLLHTEMTDDGAVRGAVIRESRGVAVPFIGLDQAFLVINEWLEEENPLSEDAAMRTFMAGHRRKSRFSADAGRVGATAGRRDDFFVRVIFREHNSWQGEVRWNGQRAYFRSALELLCLLNSALAPGTAKAKTASGAGDLRNRQAFAAPSDQ